MKQSPRNTTLALGRSKRTLSLVRLSEVKSTAYRRMTMFCLVQVWPINSKKLNCIKCVLESVARNPNRCSSRDSVSSTMPLEATMIV